MTQKNEIWGKGQGTGTFIQSVKVPNISKFLSL